MVTVFRYFFPDSGKQPSMARCFSVFWLTAIVVSVAAPVGAGAVEDRVNGHIEAAVDGGVRPADYHHLFMAFAWRGTLSDWSDAERNLDRLSGVRRVDPLMVDEIRLIRARLSLDRGLDAAARELFRTMGGLSSWWFEGPVPLEELQDFDRLAVPPPADVEWRAVPGTDPLGWVGLSGLAWPPRRQMAYLATTVISGTEQPVAVRVGTAQVARVWLNGVEVVTTPQPMLRGGDQVAGGAWLRQGPNVLVAAVASENDRWWLRVRLTRPNGSMLDNVREVPGGACRAGGGGPQTTGGAGAWSGDSQGRGVGNAGALRWRLQRTWWPIARSPKVAAERPRPANRRGVTLRARPVCSSGW